MLDPLSNFKLSDLSTRFDENLMSEALKFYYEENVFDIDLDDKGIISGVVVDGEFEYFPAIQTTLNKFYLTCDCPANDKVCAHILGLLIAWIERDHPPVRGHAPVDSTGNTAILFQESDRQLFPQITPAAIRADWLHQIQYLTVKDFRELAALYQVKLKGIKRDEVLQGMLDVLCNPAQVAAFIQRLQPDTRRLLDLLCVLADLPIFYNSTQFGPYLEAALDNGLKTRPIKECLAELTQYRLFQLTPGSGRLAIPRAVLALALPNPALFKPLAGGAPARISPAQPFRFTRLALRLLLLGQGGWLGFNSTLNPNSWSLSSSAERTDVEVQIPAGPAYLDLETQALLQGQVESREQADLAARLNEAEGLWQRQKLSVRGGEPRSLEGSPRSPEGSPRSTEGSSANLDPHLKEWLQLSAQDQSRRLFERTLSLPASLEMDLASQTGNFWVMRAGNSSLNYLQFLNGLAQARLHLARLLERIPAGQWIELESILRTLYGLQPDWVLDFARRQGAVIDQRTKEQAPIWVSIGRQRVDTHSYESWRKTYGLFHQAILVNTFHWLGLLDVGFQPGPRSSEGVPRSTEGGPRPAWKGPLRNEGGSQGTAGFRPVAVRLTRFGEFLLGRQTDFPLSQPESLTKPLILNSDGGLELDPEAAPLELVNLIIQIAAPEPPAHQAKRVIPRRFRYRLTDTGLGQAFETGWTLEQITAKLQAASGAPVPATLIKRMQPLWERYGRLQLYEDLALIQFGDDYCLPELIAGTRLSQILLFTFSPRLIAIRPEAAVSFLAELQAKGYTPRLEGSIDA